MHPSDRKVFRGLFESLFFFLKADQAKNGMLYDRKNTLGDCNTLLAWLETTKARSHPVADQLAGWP